MLRSVEAERARMQLTKEELAEKLGIGTKTYYNYVYEETDIPASVLITMSKLFNVTVDYLLQGADGVKAKKQG